MKQLELKLENQGKHATSLDLDIKIEMIYFYVRFLTKRTSFLFLLHVCLICRSIFYQFQSRSISIFPEFLQIAGCRLRLTDVPKAPKLYTRMPTQGRNKANILHLIKKAFQRYPKTLSKYCKTYGKIINKIIMQ